jgi:hypothetical protein
VPLSRGDDLRQMLDPAASFGTKIPAGALGQRFWHLRHSATVAEPAPDETAITEIVVLRRQSYDRAMTIPTEPIGSIPRSAELLAAVAAHAEDGAADDDLGALYEQAVRETIERLEALGSPVVSDGEQSKPSFATYPVPGSPDLAPGGVVIGFADGHQRELPKLTAGPFRYQTRAEQYLRTARRFAHVPVKQAVIAPSALSLLYPADGIGSYPREPSLTT